MTIFFLILPLNLGAQDLSRKLIRRKKKKCYVPDGKSPMAQGYTTKIVKNKNGLYNSGDFGLRKPCHSETVTAKKRYTSIV